MDGLRLQQWAPGSHLSGHEQGLWGNVEGTELANRCPDTIDDAMRAACDGLDRAASDTDLCFALLRHTGLSL